ncbi:MAG: 6-hydroxymethylpterin diphosphokinase MptE-like protein, partial [Ruminiclostridium sp.]
DRVLYFADNKKAGEKHCGKDIISFDSLMQLSDKVQILVTSKDFRGVLSKQLDDNGIHNYIVFEEEDYKYFPRYTENGIIRLLMYHELINYYCLTKYKSIAIIGINKYTPYLFLELSIVRLLEKVVCFVASSDIKNYKGIPCKRINEIEDEIDCLIIDMKRNENVMLEYIDTTFQSCAIADFYDVDRFISQYYNINIKKYKGIHEGQRCFIIGNGPSLKMTDLDILYENKEICFGSNRIYLAFNETNWRPNYYLSQDYRIIEQSLEEILELEIDDMFISDYYSEFWNEKYSHKFNKFHLINNTYAPNKPNFSNDLAICAYEGYSITYTMLQFAAYMGFSKIYLLGVDFTCSNNIYGRENHFCDNYFTGNERLNEFAFTEVSLAYKKAELYSRKNGFRIYNATRGGKLDEFERVNFDELF